MEKDKRKSLGELIRKRRAELGLSQTGLAQKLDITQGQMGKIERGEVSITIDRLRELSTLLKTSLINFLIESSYDTITDDLRTKYKLYSDHLTQHQKKFFESEVIYLRDELDSLKRENSALEEQVHALKERMALKESSLERIRTTVIVREAQLDYSEAFQVSTQKVIEEYKKQNVFEKTSQEIFSEVLNESVVHFVASIKHNYSEVLTEEGLYHKIQDTYTPGYLDKIFEMVNDFINEVENEKRKASEEE
ncbi:helix-turn-helix domain-containing protein [Catalinimonas niigatensis]|uniref:helix-turn-helix domain-containing protein n=1 Tax=Catalinimonas niigatensis TaxID=1397264 RepID=UPI00266599D5|nr:helix-turn-helix transcriptional regulator [Catalinimonas niigatensis]WPP47960.1 helix-turn-helix transcriptional regulator [Catalinimonas niigatensis]